MSGFYDLNQDSSMVTQTTTNQASGGKKQLRQIDVPRYSARLKTLFDNLDDDEVTQLWAYSNIDILFFPNKQEAWLAAAFDLKHYEVETPQGAVDAYLAGGIKPVNQEAYTDDDAFPLTDKGKQSLGAQ